VWLVSRGTRWAGGPATDLRSAKRDGRRVETRIAAQVKPWEGGSPRGEGRSSVIKRAVAMRTDSRVDESPEDDTKTHCRTILGNGLRACWRPGLGLGLRD